MQSGLVTKYKSVLNDGLKMPLGEALKLEKVSFQKETNPAQARFTKALWKYMRFTLWHAIQRQKS
jgi:hypothetical protein